jgi:hypothetical protein
MTTMTLPNAAADESITIDANASYRDVALWLCENSAVRKRREIALASPVFDAELLRIGHQIAELFAAISSQRVLLVSLDERLDRISEGTQRRLPDALTSLSSGLPPGPLTVCSAFNAVSSSSLKLASEQLLDRFDFAVWVTPPLLEGLRGVVTARVIGQICLALRTGDSTMSQVKRVRELADEEEFEIAASVLRETQRYLPRWVDRWLPAR